MAKEKREDLAREVVQRAEETVAAIRIARAVKKDFMPTVEWKNHFIGGFSSGPEGSIFGVERLATWQLAPFVYIDDREVNLCSYEDVLDYLANPRGLPSDAFALRAQEWLEGMAFLYTKAEEAFLKKASFTDTDLGRWMFKELCQGFRARERLQQIVKLCEESRRSVGNNKAIARIRRIATITNK